VSRVFKLCYLLPLAALLACADAEVKPKAQADTLSLDQQLEELKGGASINLADLPGKTETEKFLYLIGTPTASKSAILIFLDGQIDTLDKAGNKKQADALRENRKLLVQAVDETMNVFVERSAEVYDQIFTPEEIGQLTVIFRTPLMQKYSQQAVSLQQKMIPEAETWSTNHVVPRYQELLKENEAK